MQTYNFAQAFLLIRNKVDARKQRKNLSEELQTTQYTLGVRNEPEISLEMRFTSVGSHRIFARLVASHVEGARVVPVAVVEGPISSAIELEVQQCSVLQPVVALQRKI